MALSKDQKKVLLAEMQDRVDSSQGLVFTDFNGLSVKSMQDFRRQLREVGGRYKVVKKTLFAKSLYNLDIDNSSLDNFPGNLGVVYCEDTPAGAKTVYKFSKSEAKLVILGGLLDNSIISDAQVKSLATLPSKEQLQAQLVGTIAAPMTGFVNVLAGNMRGLLNVLNAYKKSQAS
jgi:large subunit ribosomal protein L10